MKINKRRLRKLYFYQIYNKVQKQLLVYLDKPYRRELKEVVIQKVIEVSFKVGDIINEGI